jgi:hypothetical protein
VLSFLPPFRVQPRRFVLTTYPFFFLLAVFPFCVVFIGPVATITWYPVPSRGWRRMAVPDARATSPDGVEALMARY